MAAPSGSVTAMRWIGVGLSIGIVVITVTTSSAQAPPSTVRTEAARLYLSQSLASIAHARAAAVSVVELGGLEGFDLARYLAELDQIARGVQRYLAPEGPGPDAAAPVAITGQYLFDGLQRGAPSAPITQPGK